VLVLNVTLGCIMLALGLGLVADDFRAVASSPRAALVGLGGQLVLLPVAAFAVAAAFGLEGPLAVGLVLIASCPGGAHSNLFANLAGGDTALSVALTATSGLVVLATLPLWVGAALALHGSEASVALPIGDTVVSILGIIGLPLVAGMALRARSDVWGRRLEPWIKGLAIALLLLIVVGSVAKNGAKVLGFAAAVGPAVLALNVGTMALGGVLAGVARLPRPQVVTVTLEVGVQNSVLAVGLGLGLLGDPAYAVPAIVYSLLVYATAGSFVVAARATRPR